jgi:hypothetical protein
MTDFLQLISTLREQMHATLSRSDVLRPLAWLLAILIVLIFGLIYLNAPNWIILCAGIALFICVVLYAGSYIYCLLCDRDALRSERYSLDKLAIEHGIYGDSNIGLIDPGSGDKGLKQIGGPGGIATQETKQ